MRMRCDRTKEEQEERACGVCVCVCVAGAIVSRGDRCGLHGAVLSPRLAGGDSDGMARPPRQQLQWRGAAGRWGGLGFWPRHAVPCRARARARACRPRSLLVVVVCLPAKQNGAGRGGTTAQDHDHGGPFWPLEAHGATDDSSESETGSSVG